MKAHCLFEQSGTFKIEPYQNCVFEPIDYVEYRTHQGMKAKDGKSKTVRRSEIHPQYANRFIRQYLIEDGGNI